MNLAINFVWIGTGKLGWLECFIIYSWKVLGCEVNLFTSYNEAGKTFDAEALGLPEGLVNVHDLPTIIAEGESMPKTRVVLKAWFTETKKKNMGGLFSGDARRTFTFNIVDLCKSFLAATRKGVVMDLKIGPSPHIKKYVDSGIFESTFVGCKRVSTVENQLMGSMSDDDTKRTAYGEGFEHFLFSGGVTPDKMKTQKTEKWFSNATLAHGRAMGSSMTPKGLKGGWFDIGKYGKARHAKDLGISGTDFVGIAEEEEAGAVRVFKREADQTNKSGNTPTTDEERLEVQRVALSELPEAPTGEDSFAIAMQALLLKTVKSSGEVTLSRTPVVVVSSESRSETVREDTTPGNLIINYVWLGCGALGALEKFNIYCWRAKGHSVGIYTHHFTSGKSHTFETLGLAEGDAEVHVMPTVLSGDDEASGSDNPVAAMANSRAILKDWMAKAVVKGKDAVTMDNIYNMADLTKSYVGATRRGIVIDFKVGPSPHVAAYEAKGCFTDKFVSYSRGGKTTTGGVENQCIGTMQEANTLRLKYAKEFDKKFVNNILGSTIDGWKGQFNTKSCDKLTAYHGKAFTAAKPNIDVTKEAPSTSQILRTFAVSEIVHSEWSYGPFRVFKRATEQSNSTGSGPGTSKRQVKRLATDVWQDEIQNCGGSTDFIEKAGVAKTAMPEE